VQVAPQLIPAGLLVTVPVPFLATVSLRGMSWKVAVTARSLLIENEHAPVPEHEPLQPANIEPKAGVAVRPTLVDQTYVALHVAPQLMPDGELVTVPLPVPDFETLSVWVSTTNVAVTERLPLIVNEQAPVPPQLPLQPENTYLEDGVSFSVTVYEPPGSWWEQELVQVSVTVPATGTVSVAETDPEPTIPIDSV